MYYNPLFLQTDSIQESAFYATDLGKIHRCIPFKELASKIPSPAQANSGRGRKAFLKVEGAQQCHLCHQRKQKILQQPGHCKQFYTQRKAGEITRAKNCHALCIKHCKSNCAGRKFWQ